MQKRAHNWQGHSLSFTVYFHRTDEEPFQLATACLRRCIPWEITGLESTRHAKKSPHSKSRERRGLRL
jgi:hypothetical protein